ncbi:MAG: AmmeMemoRadiSam system protein A [Nanobdellota archaeon]
MILQADGQNLLKLARESINTYFSGSNPDINNTKHLTEKRGLFVTLHENKSLRGCIGFPEATLPLYQAVIEAARSAAFKDPRFSALSTDELEKVHIEISVLTPPKLIKGAELQDYEEKIEIGTHGLIIKHPMGTGLLLPQVPVEQNWNKKEFLENICLKGGLPSEVLNNEKTELYSFKAQIFSE